MDFSVEAIRELINTLPKFIRDLMSISPHIGIAVVIGFLVRFSLVPLIKAWKDDD